jgi:hypothetical protein
MIRGFLAVLVISLIAFSSSFAQKEECCELQGKAIKDTKLIIQTAKSLGWEIGTIYATTLATTAKGMVKTKDNSSKGPIKFCFRENKGKLETRSGFASTISSNSWSVVKSAKKK